MVSKRTTKVVIVSIVMVFGVYAGAASRNGRTLTDRSTETNSQQSRKEQMRQEAQATHQQVKDVLTELLGAAVKNERPSDTLLAECEEVLEENKQNALAYDQKQRADYMLLQAWTGYYRENLAEALSWSMRACKQDEASQDAWISQAVFNMLSGKRPLEPRIEKPKPELDMRRTMNPRPRRNNQVDVQKYEPEPYSVKGTLDFDLLSVRSEMFRERFERMECRTMSGKTIEYVPGRDIFCALFWQSVAAPAEETDPNSPTNGSRAPAEAPRMLPGYGGSSQGADIDSQRQYFLNLMKACKDVKSVKFVQVDTIRPKDLSSVSLSSYDDKGVATVVAAHPDCNAKRLACDASVPFMMVVDKDGAVKYAGPGAGFVPAFILSEISGQAIDTQPQGLGMLGTTSLDRRTFELRDLSRSFKADPNVPAADPNQPRVDRPRLPTQAVPDESDFPGQELEDQYDAQKLLQLAQMKIEQSRTIRGSSPEQGIIAARKVIEKYPNTPEAQKAKELLRRVPDRYKQKYNITEEELL